MSDHLCELNDTIMRQKEELELLTKNKVGEHTVWTEHV